VLVGINLLHQSLYIQPVKKVQILIVLVFKLSWLTAQDYVAYQAEITKAEQLILDSSYTEAVSVFGKLFQQYDFVFAKDCYTALQVAITITDDSNAEFFLKKRHQTGIFKRTHSACSYCKRSYP
jgi:hypothetical protein